jgi:hypothetical protein
VVSWTLVKAPESHLLHVEFGIPHAPLDGSFEITLLVGSRTPLSRDQWHAASGAFFSRKFEGTPKSEKRQMNRVATFIPLTVGISVIACTIVIHGVALTANLHFVRYERSIGRAGTSVWTDVLIVSVAVMLALMAHLTEIGVWAALFVLCGEFQEFGQAVYHSAMNYTTLGYGDIVMSSAWKVLGPLEATDGLLMFGVSTAMIFAVIQRLARTRFPDLRS